MWTKESKSHLKPFLAHRPYKYWWHADLAPEMQFADFCARAFNWGPGVFNRLPCPVGPELCCFTSSVSLMTTPLCFSEIFSLLASALNSFKTAVILMGKPTLCLMTLKSPILSLQLHEMAKSSAAFSVHQQQPWFSSCIQNRHMLQAKKWLQTSVHLSNLPSLES